MSLERKCLLFFGSALVVLMCVAFCVVLMLARSWVEATTQQQARDAAYAELLLKHAVATVRGRLDETARAEVAEEIAERRDQLLSEKVGFDVLGLPGTGSFRSLPAPLPPQNDREAEILRQLLPRYRARLAQLLSDNPADLSQTFDLGQDAADARIGPASRPVFAYTGPVQGRYTYYAPAFMTAECMTCHGPVGKTISLSDTVEPAVRAAQTPFRVMRVTMPDDKIVRDMTRMRAIVVAVAMLIIAATLFVLHAIVRYLVLQPLLHLRDVSDAITHGETTQRAVIDTEDEFRELGDAFNRMLRHLTETQSQLQRVNRELDGRVDQFAQLNLQLYEANQLKTDFLANMSHELRTPLNSIIGFSEVLTGIESLSEKQRRYASNIQKSGRLLLEMINDILDLAKVEAGKMEVRATKFKLDRIIGAQVDMIQSLSEDKQISLIKDLPDDLPVAHQDSGKLGQILNNLLSNAIKFTPEGGIVTIRVVDLLDGRFRLSVADTGVGIAPDDQPIVFEKFRQSRQVLNKDGLTREFAGTGLGLSIVKELSVLLGGEVDFQSELGSGTTFWVTLPFDITAEVGQVLA